MRDEFGYMELSEAEEDVAAELNAEILEAIEYQADRNIANADDIDYAEIIFETVDDFLKQYNGKASRYEIMSDNEIHNALSEKDADIDNIVYVVSCAVASYLKDNNLI